MSLLLDALNKADQERKRNDATPSIDSVHENALQYQRKTISTPLLVIAASILLAAILFSVYWLGKHTQGTELAKPAVSITSLSSQAVSSTATIPNTIDKAQTEVNADNNQPEESVANLYQQKNTVSESPSSVATIIENTPATQMPKTEAISLNSLNQFGNVPEIHDLPQSILTRIPSMNYSEHNFNNVGGSVKINGQIKHINDQVSAGVVIDKILEDGMILHFENYEFKMRALNSWVNM